MQLTIRNPLSGMLYPHRAGFDFVAFVDETGQDRKPGKKGLAALLLPRKDLEVVEQFVRKLVGRLKGDASLRVRVKGRDWPPDFARALADLIRNNYMNHWRVEVRLVCPPKTDPDAMRVQHGFEAGKDCHETQATHARPGHCAAA